MADDSSEFDAETVRAAYAEKVKEAFKVFAENLGVGHNEATSKERFLRSLQLLRRARDTALEVIGGIAVGAGTALSGTDPAAASRTAGDDLSAEDQAMIEQALAGTTGLKQPRPRR